MTTYAEFAAPTVKMGKLLYEADFSKDSGDWVWEGWDPELVTFRDGALEIDAQYDRSRAINVWLKQKLPQNIRVEVGYQVLREGGNSVIMLPARLQEGLDLIAESPGRNGSYAFITNQPNGWDYKKEELDGFTVHPMYGYTVSLWSPEEYRIPIRKNPGHNLLGVKQLTEKKPEGRPEKGERKEIVIESFNGWIRVLRDGELLLEIRDPGNQEVLASTRNPDGTFVHREETLPEFFTHEGHLGLRSLTSHLRIDSLNVYTLEEAAKVP